MAQRVTKLTITIATGLFPPDIGGPATFAAHAQKEWTAEGHTVRVLSFGTVRTYPFGIRHLLYAFRLFKHARSSDIVIVLDPISVGVPAYLVSFFTRTPMVLRLVGDYAWEQYVQCHNFTTLEAFQIARVPIRFRILRLLEQRVARRMNAIIVPSHYLRSVVTVWGAAPERIHTVYNMIAPVPTQKNTYATTNIFRCISVGRLVPWKGFRAIIEVIKHIPNTSLTIVGSGPDEASLVDIARTQGVSNRVTFEYNWSREDLLRNLPQFDCFLLNTAYEGFSHTLIEAMAVGLPIITTASGGNAEVVVNNENACVVPYNDKSAWSAQVQRLSQSETMRAQLGSGAKATAHTFEGSDMALQYIHIFQTVL